ncbi:hypothetical protein LLEC1_01298 [Akanthomyces lecanii]|uniref:Beta-galactosidase n=1 Tax=Cordyceps confragosa TaxID=2714763 RepID=A0A179IIL9_CORDF|nr:hypothetical protein LLEC1_01298 [Akanthomyces lecanii]
MQLKAILAGIAFLGRLVTSTYNTPGNFSHDEKSFLLNGEPFQIIGGQMDPQRVPQEYWRQRLQMARAMGINTIFSYVFWNNLEARPGEWNFEDRNAIGLFARMAQEEGLYMVLRPGPYVCAEHEWGGFPAWLSEIPGMKVRSDNQPFLAATQEYMQHLATELREQQITRGGPILMVQLENEYGSFVAQSNGELDPKNKTYLEASAKILRDNFELMLYTNDGDSDQLLAGGTLHGVLAQTDGDTTNGFAALDRLTDSTMKGPKMNGELYVTWMDAWGDAQLRGGHKLDLPAVAKDIDDIISGGHSFNIFMLHGGTSWGYDNGANRNSLKSKLQPQITSYDYGAVIDESGRPTEAYETLREVIAKHVSGKIPVVPTVPERSQVPRFALKPAAALFEVQNDTHRERQPYPVSMEGLGQSHGYVLYEHRMAEDAQGLLRVGDMPRDRVLIYINNRREGVMDATYYPVPDVEISLKRGDILRLLVENMGRVNFNYQTMREQRKGIIGNVTVGQGGPLEDWASYSMPLKCVSHGLEGTYEVQNLDGPVFYTGTFKTPASNTSALASDTFLAVPTGVKGQVWVNGKLLGKYWTRGWQQSLYLPGAWQKSGGQENEVVVLELEPKQGAALEVEGIAERTWLLSKDPDAP